jgi:hypothetical protein
VFAHTGGLTGARSRWPAARRPWARRCSRRCWATRPYATSPPRHVPTCASA